MVGRNGRKYPAIRKHVEARVGSVYRDLDTTFETFPADDTVDERAYEQALAAMGSGDGAAIVFTPDETHFAIALAAIRAGKHVLVTKPVVKTLAEHLELAAAAREHGVLAAVEFHKRFDPIYADARDRAPGLGDFTFFHSFMSQPKHQLLETFAGQVVRGADGKATVATDISYYLNSHHIDVHASMVRGRARPISVVGQGSTGWAQANGVEAEDLITLMVEWENLPSGNRGHAVYTASWCAAEKGDVHSQQRFSYVAHGGEINIDQGHRGYTMNSDAGGYQSCNPLFMRYTPDAQGRFAAQSCYGYRSFDLFIDAVNELRAGRSERTDYDATLATLDTTLVTTAILEAGRKSIDEKRAVRICYNEGGDEFTPIGIE